MPGRGLRQADQAAHSEEAVKALSGFLAYPVEALLHSEPWADEEPLLRPYAR
ncbi:hypothetical protein ACFC09_39610 [Streptomyces sp. NPDC056161]|uniref:hypothetical protein n=1 Tax=Streptomyces sp. NPDC056161 TaxID=3345732 RepID=UPI0035E3A945